MVLDATILIHTLSTQKFKSQPKSTKSIGNPKPVPGTLLKKEDVWQTHIRFMFVFD